MNKVNFTLTEKCVSVEVIWSNVMFTALMRDRYEYVPYPLVSKEITYHEE